MVKISQKDIDFILDTLDIVDLISEYIKLEKKGRNYLGLCPFHSERTPSFTVSREKKIFHCFGCNKGGNVFQFLSQIENITYAQAVSKLASRFGIKVEEKESFEYDITNKKDSMYYAYILLADYYNYILLNTAEASIALKYLLNRGLSLQTIKEFNIGYAPSNNDSAVSFLEKYNFNMSYAVAAGVIKESNKKYCDVFNDRIIFPIRDDSGKIVAFSGRTLSKEKDIAKYYNTHETEIFEKKNILFNLSNSRPYIRKKKEIMLSEGYMDVISSYQENVKNIVGLMGTNIDNSKIDKISQIADKFILALDNDSAGIEATIKIGDKLLLKSDNVYKLVFSGSKDIDEFVSEKRKKGIDFDFNDYIEKNIVHYIEYKIDYYKNSIKNLQEKIKCKDLLLKNISVIKDIALKDILLSQLSEKFLIDKKILLKDILLISNNNFQSEDKFLNNSDIFYYYDKGHFNKKICKLFKYFFVSRDNFLLVYRKLENFKFENNIFNMLLKNLVTYYNNYNIFYIHKFINIVEDDEIINLVEYIENNNFFINEEVDLLNIEEYVNFVKNEEIQSKNVENIKDNLKFAIVESDFKKQLELLNKLKKYKK
ncbi:DNA primase [Gemelliphila asaccharolytica]|uniref:DNA primase n=1 Tax=Gemelliphila asaccharolytica TaxID=502393 RepID=A0ABR5TPM2_9BACL|nr:DNA primase [Gemella asaccharolytica]KXB58522.1 DNA primase [Gemella asaccharolytica]